MAQEVARRGVRSVVHVVPRTEGWPLLRRLGATWQSLRTLASTERGDVLYLVRTIYRMDFLALVLLARWIGGRRFVFDFDDARYLEFPRPMRLLTGRADAVVVGSHALFDWARLLNPRVHLVPTSVPFARYASAAAGQTRERGRTPVLGWVGAGRNHVENLRILVPVFRELRRRGLAFSFTLLGAEGRAVVHDVFAELRREGLLMEIVDELPWEDVAAVAGHLARFDVGLMPLEDDESARGKCAFKAIEYMACGVPTVCSRVGENRYLVEDGANGFLASGPEEWVARLRALIEDPSLRTRLGQAGQETVRASYSLEVNADRVIAIARQVTASRAKTVD